jgi:putative ABC transport system substrate-binding protein
VQIEYRWGNGNTQTLRKDAEELAALAPDVILATGGATTTYMLQATHTVPIVFVIVPDPVGSGFVKSLSRPGGNATGFMQCEYSLSVRSRAQCRTLGAADCDVPTGAVGPQKD